MNRAIRRAAAKSKPTAPSRREQFRRFIPKVFDEFEQFDEIDKLIQKLDHGALEYEGAHPIMTSGKGEVYRLLPALDGWMEYWDRVARDHGIPYNDDAMRKLSARLENGMPLNRDIIERFKRVVEAQRSLFRTIPRSQISSTARTVQIKLLIEGKEP